LIFGPIKHQQARETTSSSFAVAERGVLACETAVRAAQIGCRPEGRAATLPFFRSSIGGEVDWSAARPGGIAPRALHGNKDRGGGQPGLEVTNGAEHSFEQNPRVGGLRIKGP